VPGYAAEFAKAESKRSPRRNGSGVFVHSSGEAERIWKSQAEQVHGESWSAKNGFDGITNDLIPADPGQSARGSFVRLFRVLGEENRPEHPTVKPTHAGLLAKTLNLGNMIQ
jgi:hypothetical protein